MGINSKPDVTKKSGYRLVGDVNFEEAKEGVGFIILVPGGVGPMTIAILMNNILRAAEIQEKQSQSFVICDQSRCEAGLSFWTGFDLLAAACFQSDRPV